MIYEAEFKHAINQNIQGNGGDFNYYLTAAKGMFYAGVAPSKIYAFCKTGFNGLSVRKQSLEIKEKYLNAISEFQFLTMG